MSSRSDLKYKTKCEFISSSCGYSESAYSLKDKMDLLVFPFGIFLMPEKKKLKVRDTDVFFFRFSKNFPSEFKLAKNKGKARLLYVSENSIDFFTYLKSTSGVFFSFQYSHNSLILEDKERFVSKVRKDVEMKEIDENERQLILREEYSSLDMIKEIKKTPSPNDRNV